MPLTTLWHPMNGAVFFRWSWLSIFSLSLVLVAGTLWAQQPAESSAEAAAPSEADDDDAPEAAAAPRPANSARPASTAPVAAYVNDQPIFVTEVEAGTQAMMQSGRVRNLGVDEVKAEVLSQLIDRRVATLAIAEDSSLVRESEIQKQLDELEAGLQKQGMDLEKFCAARGFSPETMRYEFVWRLGAPRFMERNLADELEAYFNEHKRELDGTEIRASHIVLHPLHHGETKDAMIARAEQIREDILAGKLDFGEAARRYSVGPSREQGGDIGFVPRHGVMHDDFGEALFQLEVGQISEPVATPLGTHLIKATEVREGSKQWTQVIQQIRQLAMRKKLKDLIDQQRKQARIEYTGKVPHFEDGTKTLARPDTAAQP